MLGTAAEGGTRVRLATLETGGATSFSSCRRFPMISGPDRPVTFPAVASPVMWKKRSGAFFRLVKYTTSRPPWQAATGGTRHGQTYQEAASGARAGANLTG